MRKVILSMMLCICMVCFVGCGSDDDYSYETDDSYNSYDSYDSDDSYDSYDSYDSDDSYDSYDSDDSYDLYDSYDSYDTDDSYGYDPNDPYASKYDDDGDGKISEEDFADALGDAIDDMYYNMY